MHVTKYSKFENGWELVAISGENNFHLAIAIEPHTNACKVVNRHELINNEVVGCEPDPMIPKDVVDYYVTA